ncbi:MAG TPA: radical SAM protein, partial [Gammaproteobacteria bacterium]
MRVLLLTPPMTQLNTPYPATAYLTGFLRAHGGELGVAVTQADASLALFLRLFSAPWLERMAAVLKGRARSMRRGPAMPPSVAQFLADAPRYVATVDAAVRFLQGRDPSLALRIVGRAFLPEGPRFAPLAQAAAAGDDPLGAAFGALGTTDQARYLASLYVDDLADAWRDGIDPRFELARYGERLAASAPTFEPLEAALRAEPTLVDVALDELAAELLAQHRPDVVGMSVPFPGNVYGAFRMARVMRAAAPQAKLVLGGGWVNTELRALAEPRVFDYFDYITLDDGERPLLNLLARLAGRRVPLVRTYVRNG